MSTTAIESGTRKPLPWGTWRAQAATVFELEFLRAFVSRRAISVWILASLPVLNFLTIIVHVQSRNEFDIERSTTIYAELYQALILQMIVYFGCAWVFAQTFRGEVLEKSLHYLFLVPIRREVILVGKYLAALAGTGLLFGASTALSYLVLFAYRDSHAISIHFFERGGLRAVLTYTGVTLLACVGYGAVFLVIGLISKSPFVPALVVWAWEHIIFLLPSFMKKASVLFYLVSLSPVSVNEGPFAVVAEPSPAWVAIPVVFLMAAALVAVGCWRVRRMEINYGTE